MTIRATAAGLFLPILLVLGIAITSLTGHWSTKNSKSPARFTEGVFAGEANPADIRGSYTFGDIEKSFDVPARVLAEAFGQSGTENPSAIQLKTFEEIFGPIDGKEIGTDSARLFVALYKGLPYDAELTTGLPAPARTVLEDIGVDVAAHTDRFVEVLTLVHTETEEIAEPERLIKGKTTFSELLEWGLEQDEIESVLGEEIGSPNESVRDWCVARGVEFSVVKESLQKSLDE